MPTLAPKPAPKAALKKAAPAKPTFTAAVGDVVVFNEYEKPPENPLLINGDFVRITLIDATKKGRARYHCEPITADEEGNPREADTAFAEELTIPTAEQQEEIDALLAQSAPDADEEAAGDANENEDITALGELADQEGAEGSEAAQARLTELCGESEIKPEDYASWTDIAAALSPEDVEALGVSADAGDEPAQARLTELAAENSIDPEALPDWAAVATAIEAALSGEDQTTEPVAKVAKPTPGKPGAKKAPAAKVNPKKASTTPKASKLVLTESMQAVMRECNNDLLAAMQATEKKQGQNMLDLGGLIALGEAQSAHLAALNHATGQPLYEDSKKGYYQWVAANLETEERTARHLARIYRVFVAKLKFDPEGLLGLGISRLREIAPVALKLAKEDREANAAAKAAKQPETSAHLENFLQEAATLTVKDVVAKVRGYKASATGGVGHAGGVPPTRIATITFRLFEDKAAFVKTCLDAAMSDLPDAEKNADNALFRIFSEYASGAGIPEFVAKPVAKAKPALTKTPAAKVAPAPAAKPAAKAPGKKAVAAK